MKKILAAFDGLKFSESTRDYAIEMTKLNEADLVGVFLEDLAYHSYKIYDMITEEGGGFDTKRRHLDKKDEKVRAAAVDNFKEACRSKKLPYTIHKDRNIAIQELLKESIYSDLVIIDRNENMSHHPEALPSGFIRDFLSEAQCPVMLVPHKFKPIDKLILLFDGEPSSVHAIKMLSYTLPGLKNLPVEVLTVNSTKQNIHIPDGKLMKEFMKRHYPEATFTSLKGFPETEILEFLKGQKGTPLVALGAYRRTRISRWFKVSMADVLMSQTRFPLFVAHNK